ncbi:MAG: PD-(D/E)XK nuclease domain-containing protein [Gammaproteobacteria bacterium]|nr:PD-(D/E)XK nuclease domain-containing protein [Gammaproteobacteria bacterium]MCY4219750.1 PD-(D/E)XK nuclease domain-containing protein [Gammaproteobacteria bacterium]MCY4273876.1 PD-(D/E)XK nuclease domain-containing protein [Gammaproteobacteria bacterium]
MAEDTGRKLIRHLGENNFLAIKELIQKFFSCIPHQRYTSGVLGHYESWYASLLYTCLKATDVKVKAEERTSHDRSNMVVVHQGQVFVLEFKMQKKNKTVEESLNSAIAQIPKKATLKSIAVAVDRFT